MNCINYYHCIKQNNGTNFCYIKGLLDNTFVDLCLEFYHKNEKIKPCPNCTSLYRRSSNYCNQCNINKNIQIENKSESKRIRIKNDLILRFYEELLYILQNSL